MAWLKTLYHTTFFMMPHSYNHHTERKKQSLKILFGCWSWWPKRSQECLRSISIWTMKPSGRKNSGALDVWDWCKSNLNLNRLDPMWWIESRVGVRLPCLTGALCRLNILFVSHHGKPVLMFVSITSHKLEFVFNIKTLEWSHLFGNRWGL